MSCSMSEAFILKCAQLTGSSTSANKTREGDNGRLTFFYWFSFKANYGLPFYKMITNILNERIERWI